MPSPVITVVETNEHGALVLPAELLNSAPPHTAYVVEAHGTTLTLRPQTGHVPDDAEPASDALSPDEWGRQWKALSERVGAAWNTDKSAAEIIAEMRR